MLRGSCRGNEKHEMVIVEVIDGGRLTRESSIIFWGPIHLFSPMARVSSTYINPGRELKVLVLRGFAEGVRNRDCDC